MILRKTKLGEAESLTAISIRSFHSDYPMFGEYHDGPPDYDSPDWHEKMRREGHLYSFFDEENQILIGGAVLFGKGESLYIGRIFIDDRFLHQGYGRKLMNMIEEMNPEVRTFSLDTPIRNQRTNVFYQSLGYRETGRTEDMVLYRKERKR